MRIRATINIALQILGVAGLTGVVIVAPNALQGLAPLLKKTNIKKSDYARLLKELRRQKLVYITQSEETIHYTLTPAGAYRLQETIIDELEIPRPNKWDKRWRMVAFDVPNTRSHSRQKFVNQLHKLNFIMLQKSLWVHPFPCFEIVEQLAGHYNVMRYTTLIEVSKIDELATKRLIRHYSSLLKN